MIKTAWLCILFASVTGAVVVCLRLKDNLVYTKISMPKHEIILHELLPELFTTCIFFVMCVVSLY